MTRPKKPTIDQCFYIKYDGTVNAFDEPIENSSEYEHGPLTYYEWQEIFNPPLTGDDLLNHCKYDLAANRWEKTEQGVTIDGVAFQSDKNSKDEMAGYVANGVTEVHWKHSDGNIITYPIAYFTDVYHLVQQYRNDCFGVEKSKVDAMDTATDPTTVDIETGWPDTTFTTS